jgi:hypothetical protein
MRRSHTPDLVFALALFCVFAASVLLVLMSGANAYRRIADGLAQHYEERTCLSYIAAKLRHFDTEGAVSLTSFGDGDALLLTQTIEGREYGTLIYTHEGTVMELFTELPLAFGPEAGCVVLPAGSLRFSWLSDGLLHVECDGAEGRSAGVSVALRAEKEGDAA